MAAKRKSSKKETRGRKPHTAEQKVIPKLPEVKRPVGRPVVFDVEYAESLAETLPNKFVNGQSLAEVCMELGFCSDSFYKMCEISPEFSAAYKRGQEYSKAWWEKLGRAGAAGQVKINPATWIFNMKNRHGYRDRHEHMIEAGESFTDVLKRGLAAEEMPPEGEG